MLYFFKPLPASDMDFSNYQPFIKNKWFRKNFMKFVYALQIALIWISAALGVWKFSNIVTRIGAFIMIYLLHELLHILVVYKIGDISLTYSGMFLWLNSSAIMSKKRFWLFMTLPLLGLTMAPLVLLPFVEGVVFEVLRYILWVNAIIAGSDIINSVLIVIKPANAKFCRGYYSIENQ